MTATPDFSIRMQVAGMRGLLSEIIAVGALSKHGDADLVERVREAADTPLPELPARQCLAQIEEPAHPVLYVSPGQLAKHSNPEGPESAKAGRYLPARVTPAGKFTQPLYAGAPWLQGRYPHLPQSVGDVADFGEGKVDIDWGHPAPAGGTRLYSAEQMRAYVDADRAARAEQHAAVAGPALDVTLDEDQAGLLRDMLGDPAEYEEALTVRLMVGDGHSGHGLYVAQAEYQDEGAVLLTALPAPAAPTLEAPAAPMSTAEASAALAINSALHRIRAGNAAGAIEPLEQARAALAAAPQAPAAPLDTEMLAALQAVALDVVHVGAGENTISDAARAKVEAVLEKIGAPWPSPAAAPAAPAVDAETVKKAQQKGPQQ